MMRETHYEQTSKRHSTMNKEMHLKSLWNKNLELAEFRSKMIGNEKFSCKT